MSEKSSVVVIGAGPGGYVCAIKLAQLGFKVTCIDSRSTLGGTCLNVGCIPSKALLDISEKYHTLLSMQKSELITGASSAKPNFENIMKKKDQVVSGLTSGIEGLFKKNKIEFVQGVAKFIDSNNLEVVNNDKVSKVSGDYIVIATGSEPVMLPFAKNDEKNIVSSTGALSFKEIPKSLLVIGSGVIGLEIGSVYHRLGSQVTFVEFADRITPSLDKEVSRNLKKILEKQGLKFELKTKVTGIEEGSKDSAVTTETNDGKTDTRTFEKVLVSIGRKPYTANLGLDEVKVQIDKSGFIEVNDKYQTSIPNIYAIGDVIQGPMLAHKAEEDGMAVAEILDKQHAHIDYNLIPGVIYTHPQVATIGKTEEQLTSEGVEYTAGKFPMMANSRARAVDTADGFVKILACKKTDKVLGCHIISSSAGEMIHEVAVAMEFSASSEDIARTCHAHPTFSEAIKEAALATFSKPIHS